MSKANQVTLLCKGRFLLDLQPVPSDLSPFGCVFKWSVTDYDALGDYEGLCASADTGFAECITLIQGLRAA